MSRGALKAFAPFAELSEAEREEIGELLEARHLSPGETLFAEGDDADALVLVVDGSLELSSRRTREKITVGSGAVIGGLSLLAVGPRETTALGAGRAEVRLLRRAEFLRLAEDNPRAACRIATALAADAAAAARQALEALSVDPVGAGE
jgi:CRP-like cAMP-binding protein